MFVECNLKNIALDQGFQIRAHCNFMNYLNFKLWAIVFMCMNIIYLYLSHSFFPSVLLRYN